MNSMVRLAKIGRMQKLIKLTRLVRVIKLLKQRKNMFQQVSDVFGAGFERLMYLVLVSIMVCHVSSCLWIFFSQIVEEG